MSPPDFWDHVCESWASFRRMADWPLSPEDLNAVLDAVYASREEQGLPCKPRYEVEFLILAEIARMEAKR